MDAHKLIPLRHDFSVSTMLHSNTEQATRVPKFPQKHTSVIHNLLEVTGV